MATVNSYSRVRGQAVGFFNGVLSSFSRIPFFGALDTSNIVAVRIENFVQRSGENIGDITGKVYNTGAAGSVALSSVKYSKVGPSGPWLDLTILSGDAAYSFPSVGTPSGEAFNIPVEIIDDFAGDIWFEIEVTY